MTGSGRAGWATNSYDRLGWLNWTTGDRAASAEWHRKSLEIHRALSDSKPDALQKRYNTSASYPDYGFMLAASGKIDEGLGILLEGHREALLMMGSNNATPTAKRRQYL
ncbi:MAG TPA: hypothetical protein VG778_03630 [Blastocatellia bacterium]|nr:hypothetical protein [Blastocatellia bacterium]